MNTQKLMQTAVKINEAYKCINKLPIDELKEFLSYINCVESVHSMVDPAQYDEIYDQLRKAEKRARILLSLKKNEK